MFCPKCGVNNDPDAKFCEKCGANLKEGPKATRSPKVTKEKTNPTVIVLVVICLLLVAGLGIAAAYMYYGHPASNTSQTPNNTISLSTGFPVSEAPNLCAEIAKSSGNVVNVQFNGVTLDKNQCLYILSRAIVMINNGENGTIPIKQFGDASDPGGLLNNAYITKSEYLDMAKRTYNWMDSNGRSPNHTGIDFSGSPDLSPDMTLKVFANVLAQYKSTGKLPETISV